jgi:hypothetical protein
MENEDCPVLTLDEFAAAMIKAAENPGSVSVKAHLYGIRSVEWKLDPILHGRSADLLRTLVFRRLARPLQQIYAVSSPAVQATARANGFVEGPEQQDPAFVADCKRRKAEAVSQENQRRLMH